MDGLAWFRYTVCAQVTTCFSELWMGWLWEYPGPNGVYELIQIKPLPAHHEHTYADREHDPSRDQFCDALKRSAFVPSPKDLNDYDNESAVAASQRVVSDRFTRRGYSNCTLCFAVTFQEFSSHLIPKDTHMRFKIIHFDAR